MDFSLRVNRKQIATNSSSYRDQQFQHISSLRARFQRQGLPVISVDSKKRDGTSYAAPITSTGGSGPTPYIWSVVAGSLPAGLSLTPSYGVYSAYVHGTPTTAQTSTFTLQVRDGVGHTAQQAFTLTINPSSQLVITFPSSCCPDGTVGTSYLQNFFLSGGVAPYIWSIATGQLPPGLSLAPSPPASITGTPTKAGTFMFTVRVTDSTGAHADESGSIIVH
jgi:hypothetical protein